MQYYVSLPEGWSSQKKWPVVVIIESANKEFKANMEKFIAARGKMPFILVEPMVTTNGGARYREAPEYQYSEAEWSKIETQGRCEFDRSGILAVVDEVQKKYSGEDMFFITGWEAGAHTVWPIIFEYPQKLRGAVNNAPNYQGRCMDGRQYSTDAARVNVPVRVLGAQGDQYWKPGMPFYTQTTSAIATLKEKGFQNVSTATVSGSEHGPLAAETLKLFNELLNEKATVRKQR
jgi:dienelactone hydrolase